jgi:hypothetical protein
MECHYAKCHYAECHNVECHNAECQYAEYYVPKQPNTIVTGGLYRMERTNIIFSSSLILR